MTSLKRSFISTALQLDPTASDVYNNWSIHTKQREFKKPRLFLEGAEFDAKYPVVYYNWERTPRFKTSRCDLEYQKAIEGDPNTKPTIVWASSISARTILNRPSVVHFQQAVKSTRSVQRTRKHGWII